MSSKCTVYTRTLERAVEIVGMDRLAEALGVRVGVLKFWLRGEVEPHTDAFLKAVDIVTGALQPRPDVSGARVNEERADFIR